MRSIICRDDGKGCSGSVSLQLTWLTQRHVHPHIVANLALQPIQVIYLSLATNMVSCMAIDACNEGRQIQLNSPLPLSPARTPPPPPSSPQPTHTHTHTHTHTPLSPTGQNALMTLQLTWLTQRHVHPHIVANLALQPIQVICSSLVTNLLACMAVNLQEGQPCCTCAQSHAETNVSYASHPD